MVRSMAFGIKQTRIQITDWLVTSCVIFHKLLNGCVEGGR